MESIEAIFRHIVREELDRAHPAPPSEPQTDPNRLYSIASVAELFEVSPDWVYDRIAARELAVVELGSTRAKQRVSAAELARFTASRTFPT
jgi:hypothetical protein